MLKKIFLLVFSAVIVLSVHAQSADSVYDQYVDFNKARLQGDQEKTMQLGEDLIPKAGKLPEKARTNFFFSIGKMYEDNDQLDKALPYYEKVAVAAPDYYVVHRALGYLYLENVKTLQKKLNAAQADKAANEQLMAAYISEVRKALPHLEKAQACDPSDETLVIIKLLYKNIKDTNGLNTLDDRLKKLNTHCLDILTDN